jgi:hypothetical protein
MVLYILASRPGENARSNTTPGRAIDSSFPIVRRLAKSSLWYMILDRFTRRFWERGILTFCLNGIVIRANTGLGEKSAKLKREALLGILNPVI